MELGMHTTRTLNNDVRMPVLGLGVSKAADGPEAVQAVRWALETGYRHIDTASVYGNETSVGIGVRESGIPREDVFITTKLWNDDIRAGRVREAFEESLRKMGTEYVDLYLIHWPVTGKIEKTWHILESLYKEGRVRAIGVSNFQMQHIETLLAACETVPAVNQCECHPLLTQVPLKNYCSRLGIVFEAWSPLGGGSAGNLTANPELAAVGEKYGKTAAQTILRWHLQRGIIAIPKSVRLERIRENADLFDFELTAEDMQTIFEMNLDRRTGANPDRIDS